MQEIPEEVSLLWIAKYLGEDPNVIYTLNRDGQGPPSKKCHGRYVVTKSAFLLWLFTQYSRK